MKTVLWLNEADNVATTLADLVAGDEVSVQAGDATRTVVVGEAIPFGHKVALVEISRGSHVVKYGEVIGQATATIQPGSHVHSHNLEGLRGVGTR